MQIQSLETISLLQTLRGGFLFSTGLNALGQIIKIGKKANSVLNEIKVSDSDKLEKKDKKLTDDL